MAVRLLVSVVLLVVSCVQTTTSATSTTPLKATESEIEVFCAGYREVQDLGYKAKYTALLEVAPTELKAAIFRMVNNPGPTDDDAMVTGFINEHCKP